MVIKNYLDFIKESQIIERKDNIFKIIIYDKNGERWYIKNKKKDNVINEYISHILLKIMNYNSPEVIILKNSNTYYCASKYIEPTKNNVGFDNGIIDEYYIIARLLPIIFGGHEPCELVISEKYVPYIIDCEMNFNHKSDYNELEKYYHEVKNIFTNIENIINKFTNNFINKYNLIIESIENEKDYGYNVHIQRIIKKINIGRKIIIKWLNSA